MRRAFAAISQEEGFVALGLGWEYEDNAPEDINDYEGRRFLEGRLPGAQLDIIPMAERWKRLERTEVRPTLELQASARRSAQEIEALRRSRVHNNKGCMCNEGDCRSNGCPCFEKGEECFWKICRCRCVSFRNTHTRTHTHARTFVVCLSRSLTHSFNFVVLSQKSRLLQPPEYARPRQRRGKAHRRSSCGRDKRRAQAQADTWRSARNEWQDCRRRRRDLGLQR